VPRWFAHLLLVVGWLLTPIWAWAASHVGLWVGALVALRFENTFVMLAIAGLGALLFGFAVLWTWIRFMKYLPHLLSHHMAPREGEGTSEERTAIAAAD
jgi:FtsH-binding integral membrane protein